MKKLPLSEIQHQVTYRFIGGKPEDGILSSGFMRKLSAQKSQIDFVIPYYSCFVLLSGSGEYWDETGYHAALHPGCVVQRLPDIVHSTRVNENSNWLEFYISFGKCTFDALVAIGQLNQNVPVFHLSSPELHLPAFQKLLEHMSSVPDHSLLPCLLEAQQLVCSIHKQSGSNILISPVIEQACLLLEKDLTRQLSLRQIANQLCIGYESFRKMFFEQMHQSPDQYRQQKRMITAQMMLMEGVSVQSAAKALGYSDAYAFSKQFKRFFGCPPSCCPDRLPSVSENENGV